MASLAWRFRGRAVGLGGKRIPTTAGAAGRMLAAHAGRRGRAREDGCVLADDDAEVLVVGARLHDVAMRRSCVRRGVWNASPKESRGRLITAPSEPRETATVELGAEDDANLLGLAGAPSRVAGPGRGLGRP